MSSVRQERRIALQRKKRLAREVERRLVGNMIVLDPGKMGEPERRRWHRTFMRMVEYLKTPQVQRVPIRDQVDVRDLGGGKVEVQFKVQGFQYTKPEELNADRDV